jgi:hypothetical protein
MIIIWRMMPRNRLFCQPVVLVHMISDARLSFVETSRTSAGTKNGLVLARVALNMIITSMQREDSGGQEPECEGDCAARERGEPRFRSSA